MAFRNKKPPQGINPVQAQEAEDLRTEEVRAWALLPGGVLAGLARGKTMILISPEGEVEFIKLPRSRRKRNGPA